MPNISICDKIGSVSNDINKKMCCSKNGNKCYTYGDSGKRCADTQTLTKCSNNTELAKVCKREDNLANHVCQENKDKLFCLSIHDRKQNDRDNRFYEWIVERNGFSDSYDSLINSNSLTCGACCNSSDCQSVHNSSLDSPVSNCTQSFLDSGCSNNNTIIKCQDLFQPLGGYCQLFPFNNSGQSLETINYQVDFCDIPTQQDLLNIVFGVIGSLGVIGAFLLFFYRKIIKRILRRNSRASQSSQRLTDDINKGFSIELAETSGAGIEVNVNKSEIRSRNTSRQNTLDTLDNNGESSTS